MVVEVLVAASQRQAAFGKQFLHRVFHPRWVAVIDESVSKLVEQAHAPRRFTPQKDAAIATDSASVESCLNPASAKGVERHGGRGTLCRHRAVLCTFGMLITKTVYR